MKLMVLSTLYAPRQVGGAEKIARILAGAMSSLGHECVVVTTQPGPGLETARVDGVRVIYLGLRNIYWPYGEQQPSRWLKPVWHLVNRYNPAMGREVNRLLDQERPDVVHTHSLTGFSPAVWAGARSRHIPVVHTLHDYSLICPKASMFRDGANCASQCRDCRAWTLPARRLSQQVQAVVGVSRYTLQRHLDLGYFGGASIRRVVHNGLPGPMPEGAPPQRTTTRLRLGFAGRLVRPKGLETLLGAMRALDGADCELLVAGRGSEEDERRLRDLAPPHVRFLGFIAPDRLYEQIDLLVVPSLWQDPLPTTAIEAMRHGVPAIVTDRGGLPDIVLDGVTGRVVEAGSPDALRRAIEEFISQPHRAARMRAAVRTRAGVFTADRMAADYAAVLEAVRAAAMSRAQGRLRPSSTPG